MCFRLVAENEITIVSVNREKFWLVPNSTYAVLKILTSNFDLTEYICNVMILINFFHHYLSVHHPLPLSPSLSLTF